jgi:hypothetical protein
VLADLDLGFVSVEAARDEYGVALFADGSVDDAQTRRLRAAMATQTPKGALQ